MTLQRSIDSTVCYTVAIGLSRTGILRFRLPISLVDRWDVYAVANALVTERVPLSAIELPETYGLAAPLKRRATRRSRV